MNDDIKKIYVAGKITGRPEYKTEFMDTETFLTAMGFKVMNPSIMPEGFEQSDYLHVCTAMIDVCDAVYFLPTWIDSKGSHYEMGYAKGKGKRVLLSSDDL